MLLAKGLCAAGGGWGEWADVTSCTWAGQTRDSTKPGLHFLTTLLYNTHMPLITFCFIISPSHLFPPSPLPHHPPPITLPPSSPLSPPLSLITLPLSPSSPLPPRCCTDQHSVSLCHQCCGSASLLPVQPVLLQVRTPFSLSL